MMSGERRSLFQTVHQISNQWNWRNSVHWYRVEFVRSKLQTHFTNTLTTEQWTQSILILSLSISEFLSQFKTHRHTHTHTKSLKSIAKLHIVNSKHSSQPNTYMYTCVNNVWQREWFFCFVKRIKSNKSAIYWIRSHRSHCEWDEKNQQWQWRESNEKSQQQPTTTWLYKLRDLRPRLAPNNMYAAIRSVIHILFISILLLCSHWSELLCVFCRGRYKNFNIFIVIASVTFGLLKSITVFFAFIQFNFVLVHRRGGSPILWKSGFFLVSCRERECQFAHQNRNVCHGVGVHKTQCT